MSLFEGDIQDQYVSLLKNILNQGVLVENRTDTKTLSTFGVTLKHDLSKGFPALTLRKLAFKTMFHELIWFLSGKESTKYLEDNNVGIWRQWTEDTGKLKYGYGTMWMEYPGYEGNTINQLQNVIDTLKNNPTSRRMVVSAWNPAVTHLQTLAPCHMAFAFYADNGKLSCNLFQRSCDLGVGWGFNIAQYSLLIHLIAQIVNMPVGEFVHSIVNAHIYEDHIEGLTEMLTREKKQLPTLWVDSNLKTLENINIDSAKLENYDYCKPQIKFPVAV